MGIVFELHAYMSLFKRSYDVKSEKIFHHSYASSSFFFRTPLHRFVYFFSHFLVAFLCSMICWSSYTGCGSCTFRVRVCCFSPASNYLHYFYSPLPSTHVKLSFAPCRVAFHRKSCDIFFRLHYVVTRCWLLAEICELHYYNRRHSISCSAASPCPLQDNSAWTVTRFITAENLRRFFYLKRSL